MDSDVSHVLGREVVDLPCRSVVLLREREDRCDAYYSIAERLFSSTSPARSERRN